MSKKLIGKSILIIAICLIVTACGPEQSIPTFTNVPNSTEEPSTVTHTPTGQSISIDGVSPTQVETEAAPAIPEAGPETMDVELATVHSDIVVNI